jgi:hypothetical protein
MRATTLALLDSEEELPNAKQREFLQVWHLKFKYVLRSSYEQTGREASVPATSKYGPGSLSYSPATPRRRRR